LGWSGGIAQHIFNLGMEVRVQFHSPSELPPDKEPRYSLHRRLNGSQNRSGRDGKELESNRGRPARSLVTVLTEVPQFIPNFTKIRY